MKASQRRFKQIDRASIATVIGACAGFIMGILITIELYQTIGIRAFTSMYPVITIGLALTGGFGAWLVSRT